MGPTPFYGARSETPPQKPDFAMKQTNICRLSGNIKIQIKAPKTYLHCHAESVQHADIQMQQTMGKHKNGYKHVFMQNLKKTFVLVNKKTLLSFYLFFLI